MPTAPLGARATSQHVVRTSLVVHDLVECAICSGHTRDNFPRNAPRLSSHGHENGLNLWRTMASFGTPRSSTVWPKLVGAWESVYVPAVAPVAVKHMQSQGRRRHAEA